MGVARALTIALLRVLMILIFAGWISLWLLKPTDLWTRKWKVAENHARNTVFGYYGLNFAVFTFPMIAIAIIGLAYLSYESNATRQRQSKRRAFAALSNPLAVSRLLGIFSMVEILAICLFVLFLAWTFYVRVSKDFKNLMPMKNLELNTWQLKYLRVATRFGLLSEACLALLLFPVLRVLPIFRILGIPFEASIRYHTWLGTAMIFFATFHGASTLFIWGVSHQIEDEFRKWQRSNRIYLAGEIGLVTGLAIWITSLPIVRRKKFEIFYYTHHLYIVFLLFFLFHGGDRHFYTVFPGIFLFGLDKILRIIQSRPESCILSAKVFPNRAVELTLRKDPRVKYSPTSIVFVKIPRISKLQWHAFSVTSSSASDDETMTIIAKCEGKWTSDLYQMMQDALASDSEQSNCPDIFVEGPYGPPSVNFLRYDSLILIAGGIGITPFLSIIHEIASSGIRGKFIFPERVRLIYVTKNSQDICLLNSVWHLLWNQTAGKHQPKLKVYVTQEQRPNATSSEIFQDGVSQSRTVYFNPKSANRTAYGMGSLLQTAAIAIFASILFFAFLMCLNHVFVPKEKKSAKVKLMVKKGLEAKQKTPSSVVDLILLASFFLSLIGSAVVVIILRWRRLKEEIPPASPKKLGNKEIIEGTEADGIKEHEIHFGGRPNFRDMFTEIPPDETGGSDVGVLVCGPESMKESVARACREICLVRSAKGKAKFTFHSLNFTL